VLVDRRGQLWGAIWRFPKPIVAAVNGFALGGGCEIAMGCDIIIAGDNARFGQPEVNLGIIPGAGGTQRLPRAVGKSLAMKMILAAEQIDARAALQAGLVAEVTPKEMTLERAIQLAVTIAAKPPLAVRVAKELVLRSFDMTIDNGLDFERKSSAALAGTEDRQEGVAAFIEKRKGTFKGR
jgi:enoyl-CoA hydratase